MAQYCDSKVLERNWFNWLLASRVPKLECFRNHGVLWTKVVGTSRDRNGDPILEDNKPLPNAMFPIRVHCLALSTPIFFTSYQGIPQEIGTIEFNDQSSVIVLQNLDSVLDLLSESQLHRLDHDPFRQACSVIPTLQSEGFIKEEPCKESWHAMLENIQKMCNGISMKFHQKSEDEQSDLATEALLQVSRKLVAYKLVYMPGKAPVFNLLTTTIHRCMYSIINRKNHQRNGLQKLLSQAEAGILPDNRSLRAQNQKRIKSRC